jgi:hypothetical protein
MTKATDEQLAKEAAQWDARKDEPNLRKNLEAEGWKNAPEALPAREIKGGRIPSPVAARGLLSVRRLLDTDPCPCKSGKPFGECEKRADIPGLTPENTLHMLFEERDPTPPESGQEPLTFYAIQTAKMDGKVPPEEIVANIAKRLHAPAVARALDRLEWHAVNSRGLKMTMMMPPDTTVIDPPKGPTVQELAKKIELYDKDGNPVK